MTYRYKVAVVFLLGFFIDCVNIFMSAVALPSIAGHLQVSSAAVAWVANAYILGLTLVIAISTWLAGRFGNRQVLCASMLLFSGAGLMCGLADSFMSLVFWRLVQGMAGGLLIPLGQALTFNLFQGAQRSRISTLVMAVALLAPALSPTLGGAIVDHSSWRWVFFASVPLSLLAALLSWCWIAPGPSAPADRPDLRGLLLVSASLGGLLLGMSLYGSGYPAYQAAPSLIAGLLLAECYRRHCRACARPIVELRLLKNPRLGLSVAIYHAIPGIFTGVNLLSLFFLQEHLHLSARHSGMFMLLYAAGALLAMLVGGHCYNRLGAARLFAMALVLHSAGIASLCWVDSAADLPLLMMAYLLMGLGGGAGANTAQTTALLDFNGADTHRASVIWNINRQVAFSLGAAWLLMLYNLLLGYADATGAYHLSLLLAAAAGLLPLLTLNQLPTMKAPHAQLDH
ncbi:MFS transporter [Pseudomonas sp. St29]|uniref:MFS transporter n=1 Tax=Pseudomonas sp. St29 TaxID=1500687 RepID=UPI0005FCBD51|nr:MFS transporter [Pseudomonas sp. St29]BAQ79473.1 major facilitator family transporter [Pseudomonas sp. St29]